MSEHPKSNTPDPSELLSAYLDGQLSAEQMESFQQLLQDSPQLREEVEMQGEIDASLARSFTAPSLSGADLEWIQQQASQPASNVLPGLSPTKKRVRFIAVAIAACVVWFVVGATIYDRATDDGYRQVALQDIYHECLDNGFQPKWVCEDDVEFAETFARRQGQGLRLEPIADGSMVGLSYLRGLSRSTTAMLARVDGEPILVFVERQENDIEPKKPSWWSGLHLYRKELAGLVLYEVSPLDEPRVLDSLRTVDVDGAVK